MLQRRSWPAAAAILAFSLAALRAQTTTPKFEVASLKMSLDQNRLEVRPTRTVGRFRWTTDLMSLLQYVYSMVGWRISGVTANPICEIAATTDPDAGDAQVRLMLQSLLIERFQMSVHRVTKEVTGYALTVEKNGPKMQEAREGEIPALPDWMQKSSSDPAGMEERVLALMQLKGVVDVTGRRVTMAQLTDYLQRHLDTAVLDQTGLTGKYYFAMRYATGDDPDAPFPSVFGAMKELGLGLEKHKGPVETLVIDHMERIPTGN